MVIWIPFVLIKESYTKMKMGQYQFLLIIIFYCETIIKSIAFKCIQNVHSEFINMFAKLNVRPNHQRIYV